MLTVSQRSDEAFVIFLFIEFFQLQKLLMRKIEDAWLRLEIISNCRLNVCIF